MSTWVVPYSYTAKITKHFYGVAQRQQNNQATGKKRAQRLQSIVTGLINSTWMHDYVILPYAH